VFLPIYFRLHPRDECGVNNMIERFGAKLRTLRKRQKMTQQELAAALGVARSYISFLENNEREPSGELVLKVAHLFTVSTDQLLEDEWEV
jgi:transcriptional regulator with XRE-family HTH domain